MPKSTVQYECQNCGYKQPRWAGQCPSCDTWNSMVEVAAEVKISKLSRGAGVRIDVKVQKLSEIDISETAFSRLDVGSAELDQVMGGGLVKGSVVLMAGQPGIGKSTILSQLTLYFAAKHGTVLYVCGEESVQQVKLRLERLSGHKKTSKAAMEKILLLPETQTELIVAAMEKEKPLITIIDSIQTMTCGDLSGMAGSVGQVRESGNRIMQIAKRYGLSTFIVGHVTKAGTIGGPKVLEHMVDTVLTLEGQRDGNLRLLRAMKNRFGPVDEVGVFKMNETGLVDVQNASSAFLQEIQSGVPGSAVTVLMEGTRPILTEIQALVTSSYIPTPRRVAEGIKKSRLDVICAVLEKHANINLSEKDVFINAVGGIKAHEPAADLAIALAIASSVKEKPLPKETVFVGEVGLLGEIRKPSMAEKRYNEAKKLGYKNNTTFLKLQLAINKTIG